MTAISDMYICICNNVTESELKEIISTNEIVSMRELQQFGVCDNCAACFECASEVLSNCIDDRFKDEEWYISPKEGCHWVLDE